MVILYHFWGEISGDPFACPFQASPAAHLSPPEIQTRSG
jgi:hypothetical protein